MYKRFFGLMLKSLRFFLYAETLPRQLLTKAQLAEKDLTRGLIKRHKILRVPRIKECCSNNRIRQGST